ncbi:ChaC-like protein-domain-containing protein [Chiua virens]|nr:ChaC-like protein-domain-containing protein [Chiua virens]
MSVPYGCVIMYEIACRRWSGKGYKSKQWLTLRSSCLDMDPSYLSLPHMWYHKVAMPFSGRHWVSSDPRHNAISVPGFLKGFVRRFALKSLDHRGTPENPGRVATIIHKEDWDEICTSSCPCPGDEQDAYPNEDIVWGVAFTIDPAHVAEARANLDNRETDYTIETLDVYTTENGAEKVAIHNACCYISRPDNPSFVRSEPLDALAMLIWRSVGPSGCNKDYLYQLAESMRVLAPTSYDPHLFTLEKKIRQLDKERGGSVMCY